MAELRAGRVDRCIVTITFPIMLGDTDVKVMTHKDITSTSMEALNTMLSIILLQVFHGKKADQAL